MMMIICIHKKNIIQIFGQGADSIKLTGKFIFNSCNKLL